MTIMVSVEKAVIDAEENMLFRITFFNVKAT